MQAKLMEGLVVIFIVAILLAVGAVVDHHHFVLPLQQQLAQIKGAQAQHTADVKIENQKTEEVQNETTTAVQTNYALLYSNLVDRMRHPSTPSSDKRVPTAAVSSIQPSWAIAQSSVSPADTFCLTSGADPCQVNRIDFNNAILDAARLDSLLGWVDREKFPISDK